MFGCSEMNLAIPRLNLTGGGWTSATAGKTVLHLKKKVVGDQVPSMAGGLAATDVGAGQALLASNGQNLAAGEGGGLRVLYYFYQIWLIFSIRQTIKTNDRD